MHGLARYIDREQRPGSVHIGWLVGLSILCLAACGTTDASDAGDEPDIGDVPGDGDGDGDGDGTDTSDGGELLPAPEVVDLEVAQSHVIPAEGLEWTTAEGSERLVLASRRDAMVLLRFAEAIPGDASLEVSVHGTLVGTASLSAQGAIPATEANGPSYATDMYVAQLEAAWVMPGLSLRVVSSTHEDSEALPIEVGADSELLLWTLPFYLYGADDTSLALDTILDVPAEVRDEFEAKLPYASSEIVPHPAQRVQWDYLVAKPADGAPAMIWQSADDVASDDPCREQSPVLGILVEMLRANGDAPTNRAIYAPMIQVDGNGDYVSPKGGCGGGNGTVAAGDEVYAGIFIHEMGHALRLPHAAGSYDAGNFPYPNGSLDGSTWGYDMYRDEFLATFVPENAVSDGCENDDGRRFDARNRCIKQDPMQSGSGDQAEGYRFTMFADFSAGRMQRYYAGVASINEDSELEYSEGRVFVDEASSTGYSRWNSMEERRVEVEPLTTSSGLWGLDGQLPAQRDVPVHTIVFTVSAAQTQGATQIYPPVSYIGNLPRLIDPTDMVALEEIALDTGELGWFCHNNGCDYTLRVTFENGDIQHVLIQRAFRSWFGADEPLPPESLDPLDDASFRVWAINVSGEHAITTIELLDTPMAWQGIAADPPVIASRTL